MYDGPPDSKMSRVNDFGHNLIVTLVAGFVFSIFHECCHQRLLLVYCRVVGVELALNILEHFASVVGNHNIKTVESLMGHSSVGFSALMNSNAEVEEIVFGNTLESEVGGVPFGLR